MAESSTFQPRREELEADASSAHVSGADGRSLANGGEYVCASGPDGPEKIKAGQGSDGSEGMATPSHRVCRYSLSKLERRSDSRSASTLELHLGLNLATLWYTEDASLYNGLDYLR